nr:hypothetical protein [Actinomycetota bacterium]
GEQGSAGQLAGEVAGIGAQPHPPRPGRGRQRRQQVDPAGRPSRSTAWPRGSSLPAINSAASTVAVLA